MPSLFFLSLILFFPLSFKYWAEVCVASPFSLLPIGLAVISPIISMSNDTTGMKPNLPVLYTFPFLQNKREPNQTCCNIRLQGLGLISQLSLLCSRILAVIRQLDFCQSPWANFIYSACWLLLLHNTESICFIMKPTEYLFWFLFLVVNRVQNTLYYHCSKLVKNYVNNQHSDLWPRSCDCLTFFSRKGKVLLKKFF